ncbi:MAG TPA: serine/threonine-protein kinase, partial [Bacteroidota bacterium]|nr:serine/threonine-protein kinase [Bacteroidota bacterium]
MEGKILSHYRIIEKLGEGGMGVVYKAEDLTLRRFVAIKVFPSIATASVEERNRFFQEARLASSLNHPNIVIIHEFDEVGGNAFMVSECVEGRTLNAIMQEAPLSIEKVLDVAIQTASGIAAAHVRGIVHRDIKPDNVMVTREGQVKVMDFGLARLVGSSHMTSAGSLIGTFAYMSPEQINEQEIDARSDIFSFGTLLYQSATGKLPFQGKTIAELLSSIARKHPESPKISRPELPDELVRIIVKALHKDRSRRYQTMEELKIELERLRDNPSMKPR